MQILQTATEALETSEIQRIAYLCPRKRTYLTRTTGHPDPAHTGLGEVIADMGGEIVTLTYVDSGLKGFSARVTQSSTFLSVPFRFARCGVLKQFTP